MTEERNAPNPNREGDGDANLQNVTGASSQTPQPQAVATPPPEPPPPEPVKRKAEDISLWAKWSPVLGRFLGRVLAVFGALTSFLWLVALLDSYRPKITVSPGATLNSKLPFSTIFTAQNQGELPIEHIRYITHWTIQYPNGITNLPHFTNSEQNVTVIPQMQSLECYGLSMGYPYAQLFSLANTASTNAAGQTNSNRFAISAILLWFEVSYEPKFFHLIGKRTNSFYFAGIPDVEGNWQWFPSAHQSITDQIIDTNLLPHPAVVITPGETTIISNPAPTNASQATATNGGSQVHKN